MFRLLTNRYIPFGLILVLLALTAWLLPAAVNAEKHNAPSTTAFPLSPTITTTPTTSNTPESVTLQDDTTLYLPIISRADTIGSVPTSSDPPQPIVVQQSPAPGEELAPDGAIELVFDRPMQQSSVVSAFQMVEVSTYDFNDEEPASMRMQPASNSPDAALSVSGSFTWSDERTVAFQPDQSLARNSRYHVSLEDGVEATDGTTFAESYDFRLTTAGYLEVAKVVPDSDASGIAIDSTITVMFNRPVVPLHMIGQQDNVPHPLTFAPAIAGSGKWLNTSIYVFQPEQPLQHSTTYHATVDGDLTDAMGNPMQGDYLWSFTTRVPPAVEVQSVIPHEGAGLVPIDTTILVHFSQSVEPDLARQAFQLNTDAGSTIAGSIEIEDDTLHFTPAENLDFDTTYNITIYAGVASTEDGSPMKRNYRSTFTTVPLPKIIGTSPADGEQDVSPDTSFRISFNAPIDRHTVMSQIEVTPPFSPTQVYTSFSSYRNMFRLSFAMRSNTCYTITIGPEIADRYGNTIGQSLETHFCTESRNPYKVLLKPGSIATYSAYNPSYIRVRTMNYTEVDLKLYQLQARSLRQSSYYYDPPAEKTLLREWTAPIDAASDTETITRIPLAEGGGSLEPGVYMVELLDSSRYYDDYHILVVSPLNLTLKASERDALVWVNDLQTGEPVAGLMLNMYDNTGTPLGSARTNDEGVAIAEFDRTVNKGVLVTADNPFAAASTHWHNGVSAYNFGLPQAGNLPEMTAHIYTDRPIYRPDQTVFFKGILRAEDDVQFNLPASLDSVEVVITTPTDEEVLRETLALNDNATFDGSLELSEDATLGTYSIRVSTGTTTFHSQFEVAEYRVPEFEVNVEPQEETVVLGTPVQATVVVSYFFGLPVQNAAVEWSVKTTDYHYAPDWAQRYDFGTDDVYSYCRYCWWREAETPETIMTGEGRTDEQGRLQIALPAVLEDSDGMTITTSKRLIIEASVTGTDNQVVSNRSEVTLHGSDIYVGLAKQSPIGKAGEAQGIDLLTVTKEGNVQPEQTVEVAVYKREWENIYLPEERRWTWSYSRTLIAQETTTTDAQGQGSISFIPPSGGSYLVIATTRDSGNRAVSTSIRVWVWSDGYVSWRFENHDRITLIADKHHYQVGETAEIFIPSPFQTDHWALVTVERGGTLSHEVLRMQGNSEVYRLPITAEHLPNIYVSVVLFSPPTDGIYRAPTPADYKVGIVPLTVEVDPKALRVNVESNVAQAEPGEMVQFTLKVTDQEGNPVAAELSLDLVDKAVLSLMPRMPAAILEAFYTKRSLGVLTASSMAISGDRVLYDEEEDEKDREYDEEPPEAAPPSPTPQPVGSAPDEPPEDEGDDDGGGNREEENASSQPSVREEFADTAYWNANVQTDSQGEASVDVTLPDNLTTWVLRGVGVTSDTKVGEGTTEVVANKPLMIRPVAPRFFVVGDEAELAANVSNRTAETLSVSVTLKAEGVDVTSPLSQTIEVPPGGEMQATWQVSVPDVDNVDLVFTAVSGTYSDASKPRLTTGPDGTLPVYRYALPETVSTAGFLPDRGTRTEVLALPPRLAINQGDLTVRLNSSLASSMLDSLTYLEHYPYECTEQTLSRFLPNVVTWQALKQLGVNNPELEERLPGLVAEGLSRLYERQRSDGGWGWWSGFYAPGNAYISSYVVFGLLQTQEAGFEVRQDVLDRGLNFLRVSLNSSSSEHTRSSVNRDAWLVYVLAEADQPVAEHLNRLYEQRDRLNYASRAWLAIALNRSNPGDERIAPLLASLHDAAIHTNAQAYAHWEEEYYDWYNMTTNTRSTAIILYAMTQLAPENQLNPNIVRWLMMARKGDSWETTQETAWSVIALSSWMEQTGELAANYDYAVWTTRPQVYEDREILGSGHINPSDVNKTIVLRKQITDMLSRQALWLTIGRGTGNGPLYYTAHLRTFKPAEDVAAMDRGVTVHRRYTLASCEEGPACPEVDQVKLGDVVRVEVSLTAPDDLYYIVVEDPLPAGAEVIDTRLATTGSDEEGSESSAKRDGWWWWYWWWYWRWYDHEEYRDEKVVLFADHLYRGSYTYSYTMRATLPGKFRVIPTTASEMYFPEVYGRGDGQVFEIVR